MSIHLNIYANNSYSAERNDWYYHDELLKCLNNGQVALDHFTKLVSNEEFKSSPNYDSDMNNLLLNAVSLDEPFFIEVLFVANFEVTRNTYLTIKGSRDNHAKLLYLAKQDDTVEARLKLFEFKGLKLAVEYLKSEECQKDPGYQKHLKHFMVKVFEKGSIEDFSWVIGTLPTFEDEAIDEFTTSASSERGEDLFKFYDVLIDSNKLSPKQVTMLLDHMTSSGINRLKNHSKEIFGLITKLFDLSRNQINVALPKHVEARKWMLHFLAKKGFINFESLWDFIGEQGLTTFTLEAFVKSMQRKELDFERSKLLLDTILKHEKCAKLLVSLEVSHIRFAQKAIQELVPKLNGRVEQAIVATLPIIQEPVEIEEKKDESCIVS